MPFLLQHPDVSRAPARASDLVGRVEKELTARVSCDFMQMDMRPTHGGHL